MRERSLREARAIARLNNINVVRVFDVLRTDADPWIVMEYVAVPLPAGHARPATGRSRRCAPPRSASACSTPCAPRTGPASCTATSSPATC